MAGERTAPDVQRMGLQAEKIWREAERRIMEDVIRRIKKAGEITSTADYQINRLIEMGKSREEVERIIKEALGATWPEMFEMYDKVAEWEYVRNREIYEQVNDDFLTPEDNKWLRQITEAARKQTKDTLVNMAQSYGFSVLMAGKRVFTPFAEYYQKYVDTAIQDVVTGGTDYNSAIRKVVTQMTNSGLRFVDYASGHTNRADVAARRAVLTGVNQITAQVSEHNAEKLDTEYFEVSWHPCARPDHQTWQGRVFSRKELGTVCGYGTVTGLCGANCRHTFHPFIPGVSERLYPDDWLEEQNKREAQTKEWNGRQLNVYEQTQQQRKMETAMRAQRQKIRLLQEAGADKDDIMLEKAKYQGQLNEYKQFSKKMGLPEQRERIYQDGLGKVATNTKQQNARYTPEMMRNAKIDSNQYERYKEVLKEDAGSLADFRQMKYNDPEKWKFVEMDYQRQKELLEHPELKLPNAETAILPEPKFTKYLFDENSQKGYPKGRAFTDRLGYEMGNWQELQKALKQGAVKYPAQYVDNNGYGDRYVQKMILYGKKETPANVVVAWLRTEDGTTKLTSAYIKEAK